MRPDPAGGQNDACYGSDGGALQGLPGGSDAALFDHFTLWIQDAEVAVEIPQVESYYHLLGPRGILPHWAASLSLGFEPVICLDYLFMVSPHLTGGRPFSSNLSKDILLGDNETS